VRVGPCPRGPRGGASARRRCLEPRPVGGARSTSGSTGLLLDRPGARGHASSHCRACGADRIRAGVVPGWCRGGAGTMLAPAALRANRDRLPYRAGAAPGSHQTGRGGSREVDRAPGSRREAGSGPQNFRAESGSWAYVR
jgi:hypothetical protein